MDIKTLILKKAGRNGKLSVADIVRATGFSRAYINRFFNELRGEGKLLLIGKANKAHYVSASASNLKKAKKDVLRFKKNVTNKNLSEDKVLDKIKNETGVFLGLPGKISKILDYAFTEMLNNAIEHSKSKNILVDIAREKAGIKFTINDNGVGIFRNIMKSRKLKNELEAIQDLLKGKQTTAPQAHTGEGIFFTSKIADIFSIKGSNKKLLFDNQIDDIFVRDIKSVNGTKIEFSISLHSKRDLSAIFKEYSNEAFEFSKTKVVVDLYKLDKEFISRSQARRILSGLDKFKTIVLDFRKVDSVGQAFADEVFRVWGKTHKDIEIQQQNANENIQFMINRALTGDEIKRLYNLGR